ncbi:MAG: bifunctional transcriptional activator/DNA repair enzyme AdaA [Pseudomonadales bacterium]
MNMPITDEQRWRSVVNRIPQDDFLYGVVTTGVVCDTGCPSRAPRRENVRYFEALADALAAGFRPCRRCLGKSDDCALVARMCGDLEAGAGVAELAEQHGMTPRHVQRLFRTVLGLSPKAFQIESRIQRFLSLVRQGTSVTEACYAAGFPSPSRLNEQLRSRTGLTAGELRSSSIEEPVFYAISHTPLGLVLLAQTVTALCFAGFYDSAAAAEAAMAAEFPDAERIPVAADQIEPIAGAFAAAMSGQFEHLGRLPLEVRGTAFQRAVWDAARGIPPGRQVSYADLAARIGRPSATRAVANALGQNRIALAIPCHRVVPAQTGRGSGGYRWGAERKAALLAAEHGG